MQARHARVPLIETETTINLAGEHCRRMRVRFNKAAREAGELLLAGRHRSAWTYFKALGDPAPVAGAIEKKTREQIDRVIEIALHEGVNPRKGFELVLEHHGICRAITLFGDGITRAASHCLQLLVSHYTAIDGWSKETIASVEGFAPMGQPGRSDRGPSMAVRRKQQLRRQHASDRDPAIHAGAQGRAVFGWPLRWRIMAAVGANVSLSRRPAVQGPYVDHAVYLRALLGEEFEVAVADFRKKGSRDVSSQVIRRRPRF